MTDHSGNFNCLLRGAGQGGRGAILLPGSGWVRCVVSGGTWQRMAVLPAFAVPGQTWGRGEKCGVAQGSPLVKGRGGHRQYYLLFQ